MNSGCQEAKGLEPKGSTLNYYDQTFPLELSNPDYLVVYVVEEMPRSWTSSCSEEWTCSGSLLKTLGPYPYKANSITDLLNKAKLRAGCDACKCNGSYGLFGFNSLKYDYWGSGVGGTPRMGPGIPPVEYIKSSLGLELLCDCPCGEWVYDPSIRQTIPNKGCASSGSQDYCNKNYIERICDQRNLKISIYYKKIDQIQPENDTVYDYDNYQKNYSLIESLPRVVNINSTINLKDFIKPSNLPCATTGGCFNTGPCNYGGGCGPGRINLITTEILPSYLNIQATETEAQTVPQAFLEMSNIKWTVVDGVNLVSEREGDLQKNPSLTFINKGTVKIKFIEKGRTLKPKIIAPKLIKNGPQGYYLIDSPEKVFANVPIEANLVKIVEIKIASEEQKIVGLSTTQSDYVFGREYVLPKYGQIFSDDGTTRQGKLIQYTSSNINVAKIQDGNKLIFFGKGKAVITAALEGDLNLRPYSVSFEIQSKLPNIIVFHYPLIGTNNTIEVNISNFSGLGHFVSLPISTSSGLPVTIKIGQGGSFYEEEGFTAAADPRRFNSPLSPPIKWGYNSLTDQYGLFIKTTGQYQVLITQQGDTVYSTAEPILLNIIAQGKTQTYSMTDFPEILTLARRYFYTDFNISLGNTTSGIILNSSNPLVAYPDSASKGWELKEPGIVTLSIKVPGNDIYAPLEIFRTLEIKTAIPNLYLNFNNQKIILPEQANKIISLAPQVQAKKGISTVLEMTSDSSADFRLKVYTYNPNSGLKEEEINTNNIYIFDGKQIVVNSDQIGEYVISLEQFATDRWASASTHFRLKIIENKIQELLYNPISPKNLGDNFIFEIKSSSKKQINLTSLDSDCVNISRISGPDASGLVKFNINILQHKPLIKLQATVDGDSSWDQKTENIYFSIITSINNSSVKTLEVSGQIPSSDYFFNDLGLNTDPAGLYELKVDYYQGLQIPFYVQKSITFSDNDGGFALINAEYLKSNKNLKILNKNLYNLYSDFINRNFIENIINNTEENSSNCCASASDQIFKINNQLNNYMLIRWRGSLKESLVSEELSYAVSESFINENNIIDSCIIYSNISLGSITNTCVPQIKYMAYQFAESLSLPEELHYCCKIFVPKDSKPCLLIKASQEEKEKMLSNCKIFIKNNSSTSIENCAGQRIKYSNGLTPEKKNVVMLDSCLAPQEIRQISLDKFSALENECFNYQIETKCSSTGEYIGTESSTVCVNCLNINRNLAVLDEEATNQEKDDNLLKIDDSILLSHSVYPVDKIKSIKINSIPKTLESFCAKFETNEDL
jgi:hypothetical protein